jgi:hypothetical protein
MRYFAIYENIQAAHVAIRVNGECSFPFGCDAVCSVK